ncbi:MAG: HD domain-containing protein [Lachnospiraceae bacterium]|jgi:putative nucleotidyltransferase with HDIG domain|nr:HD domain-containing protein [Lachnospiraceae bacterium]MBR3231430.1 HD domain-containing protein [Lachnospiraceae bacterium]MEE1109388.1 HD domain-containing protein [Lachnospiraceae bacterium]MEE3378481.1 HD domain-containing phosphohydrolase [Lachnospiraceae bacterium]MEE3437165.1 HD domain-containing phosphohydrolase [Lachnospiraceae bacterium]
MGRIVDYNLTEELAHGTYVSCLARELARELGKSEEEQYKLALAGLVHDIGKLKLANYIYGEKKIESPLVIEEMKYVRMHSMLSYGILREKGFDEYILTAVRHHHENYDGSGYPDNLEGKAIPESSRILRVCDVYAALTSDRPYRKRFSDDEAMSLMIDEINHFDMQIFLAFERVVHRIGTDYKVTFPDSDDTLLAELENDLKKEIKDGND